jgi:hypothetical protein
MGRAGIQCANRHRVTPCYNREFMLQFLLALWAAVHALFRTRTDAALEVLALRQQVAVLKRKRPRPPLNAGDRLFWTTLRRFWPRWSDVLLIVKPETVIASLALYSVVVACADSLSFSACWWLPRSAGLPAQPKH